MMLRLQKAFLIALSFSILCIMLVSGCATIPREYGKTETRKLLVTAYDASKKSTGWKNKYGCFLMPPVYAYGPHEGERKKVGITSDGTKAKKGTIAADISRYPYGTKMYVPGYGWGEVHDIGSAIKGDHIDIFFPDEKDAKAWGRKYLDVTINKP
ncbi:MAG: 3D domain-containing protein [Syntrophales bacterium]|jgi:3D (Asp-Asp-Asp) domain-containing protein